MRQSEQRPRRMTEAEIRAIVDKLADIAAVLHDADPRAIPLSQSEGMVMRHLQADPAPPPGCVAAATGLQRTTCPPSCTASNARVSSNATPAPATAAG